MKNKDDHTLKHKTEVKHKYNSENSFKLVASNKDYTAEWDFKPADLNKDGMDTNLEVEVKCMPAKAGWEGKAEFKIGGFGAGPLKAYTEIQVDSNDKQEHEVTFSQNCAFDGGYHAAVKVSADAGKKTVKDIDTIFAATGQSWGDAWVRGCVTKNFWGVGYSTTHEGDAHHTIEAQYDASKNARAGILNHPMYLRTGSCFHLENKCKLSVFSCIGQQWCVKNKLEMPVDDKFKVTFTDKMDVLAFMKMQKSCNYKVGMALEMKL